MNDELVLEIEAAAKVMRGPLIVDAEVAMDVFESVCSPENILALITEMRRLEAFVRRVEEHSHDPVERRDARAALGGAPEGATK